ncbi:MAG: hypothetical protein GXP10_01945 [Gammaproteobacteria bacterium]|nr:hypothetical protein [Gammaproteobacteria bacterium]
MNLKELTKSLSDSGALQKANDKLMLDIVRAALKGIRAKLDETEEGKVVVPILGTFIVKKVASKKGEAQIQRVILRKPSVKKAGEKKKSDVSGGSKA